MKIAYLVDVVSSARTIDFHLDVIILWNLDFERILHPIR
jgi:hypothetical protein